MDYYAFLRPLGWNEAFHSEALSLNMNDNLIPARIFGESRMEYQIAGARAPFTRAEISGSFRYTCMETEAKPAVGDWILGEPMPGTNRLRIHHVLERKNRLQRLSAGGVVKAQILAANVDTALIVMALGPDFNPARLERYLVLVRDSGVEPWIVLTKTDLAEAGLEEAHEQTKKIALGTEIFLTSASHQLGIQELNSRLSPGSTFVCLGSSGVGKSTLLNSLAGKELQATNSTSALGRGRHTTTNRCLFPLPNGALWIDTPGLREVGLWIDGDGVANAFAEIESLARTCRFRDCRHAQEPGCNVIAAIIRGELDPRRLESLRKLEREENYLARKRDKALASAEKKRWKTLQKQGNENWRVKRR